MCVKGSYKKGEKQRIGLEIYCKKSTMRRRKKREKKISEGKKKMVNRKKIIGMNNWF